MGTSWSLLQLLSNSRSYKGRSSLYNQESCFSGKVREVAAIQEKNLTDGLRNLSRKNTRNDITVIEEMARPA